MTDQHNETPKIPQGELPEERTNRAYEYAIGRNPDLKSVQPNDLRRVISGALSLIDTFEEFGENTRRNLKIPPEIAKEIGLIWDFSGPGTYDEPFKEDRYKQFPWAERMDRKRLNHAVMLERAIIGAEAGNNPEEREEQLRILGNLVARKRGLKDAIRKKGPYILYNGTSEENSVVEKVLLREGVVIPKEKVIIPDVNTSNTADQIKTFKWPEQVDKGKAIALISHSPHLARIVALINHSKPFPEGTRVYFFPVPTPQEGKEQYAQMEISGLLHNIFILRISDWNPVYKYMLGEKELEFSKEV